MMPEFHLSVLPASSFFLLSNIQYFNEPQLFSGDGFLQPYIELTDPKAFHPRYILLLNPESTVRGPLSKCLSVINSTQISSNNALGHFSSGWAGIINYPETPESEPQCHFSHYPGCILIDPNQDHCLTLSYDQDFSERTLIQIETIQSAIEKQKPDSEAPHTRTWSPDYLKEDYLNKFTSVRDYLHTGDCYQVNLAMPFHCSDNLTQQNPLPLLDAFNAPFSFYMKTEDRSVFSVTPERFININRNRIETRPIKGTAPRGKTEEEDKQLADQLKNSTKNQAENLMIVDLLRNDLSRSARPDSVKVEKLFELESHANVHHLVSTISAIKKEELTSVDVIATAFPGGSITGTPKKRAMEIIHELETASRDAYCGSAGFIDQHGYTDFNILIRSISARKDGAVCWGGGGIVIDSTAEEEYQEIFNKVQKILNTPI